MVSHTRYVVPLSPLLLRIHPVLQTSACARPGVWFSTFHQAEADFSMSPMQSEIVSRALDLLLLLLGREDDGNQSEGATSKRAERQSAVAGAEEGLLSEMLAHVAFSRAEAFLHSPMECRERAMRVTGALVDRHPTNQNNMGEVLLTAVGRSVRAGGGTWLEITSAR